MSGFAQQITQIKGLSNRRRLPRLGKVRLGFKLKKGEMEYPAELPFFLLPPEVAKVYGGKVTLERAKDLGVTRADVLRFIADNIDRLAEEIEIMLPLNDINSVFPQALKWYGNQKGIKCQGNGEMALRFDEKSKAMVEIECPCEQLKSDTNPKGECSQRGHLLFLIPKVNMGGIYQADLGSYNSIIDLNSGIDYVQALVGRFALVPLILRRIPTQTHHDGHKQVHFTLQLLMNVPINELEGLRKDTSRILEHSHYALPAPEDTNPKLDTEGPVVDVIDIEGTEVTDKEKENTLPSTTFQTYEDRMDKASSVEELQTIWQAVIVDPEVMKKGKKENQRRNDLNKLLRKKKGELLAEKMDLLVLGGTLQRATSLDELNKIWDEALPCLSGELKVQMMRIRDKKAVEFEKTKQEKF